MYRTTSSDIDYAQCIEKPIIRPYPMGRKYVREEVDEREKHIGFQLSALRHCARNDGGGGCGEGKLEKIFGEQFAFTIMFVLVCKEVTEPGKPVRISRIIPETECETTHPVTKCTEDDINRILHHYVCLILSGNST